MQMLKEQIDGKNNSWDVKWYASCFLRNKLCLYLGKPVANNIGFGIEGSTHCNSSTTLFDNNINTQKFTLKKIKVEEDNEAKILFIDFFKQIYSNNETKKSVYNKILSFFRFMIKPKL